LVLLKVLEGIVFEVVKVLVYPPGNSSFLEILGKRFPRKWIAVGLDRSGNIAS
jgi:hypothetical protein